MTAKQIASLVSLPADVAPIASRPAVHLHAVFSPTSARYWAAVVSSFLPGDRDSETQFVTVLSHSHAEACRDGQHVAEAINARNGRPSLFCG